jgi:YihY family inner membrane protein
LISTEKIEAVYTKANRWSGERLDIFKHTFESFTKVRGAQAAASMAYYAFFSLFPLLLVFVSIGGFFLESEQVYQQTLILVEEAIPVSQSLIEENLQRLLNARGAVGLIGLVGLIWSASGVFSGLAYNINLAWMEAQERSFLQKRFVALAMMGVLTVLLIATLILEAAVEILSRLKIPLLGNISIYTSSLWGLLSNLVPWFFILVLYLALYRWVPNRKVSWISALWGAIFSATAWEIVTSVFVWYLDSGLGRYEVIYGSLGAVAALMVLIYIISLITLFGAHLSAAIQMWMER